LPVYLENGLDNPVFPQMIKRLLNCTAFSCLKRLFFENNGVFKKYYQELASFPLEIFR